jgi:FkbM family methyltransferase
MAYSLFFPKFVEVLADSLGNNFEDNYDSRRFRPQKFPNSARQFLRKILLKNGFVTARSARDTIVSSINFMAPHLENLEWLYGHLADDESKETLVKVMAYRVLGHRKIRLPLSTAEYFSTLEMIDREMDHTETIDLRFMGWTASKIDLAFIGYPIVLFCRSSNVFSQFIAQQYRCETADGIIEVQLGDTVLDAGACYGDSSLYFAFKAGPSGQVFAIEFLPNNLEIFGRNLELNPKMAVSIRLVERPLWSVSNEDLLVEENGPGTKVIAFDRGRGASRFLTLTIDDLVNSQPVPAMDFIKMDIEGAELMALKGSVTTLRKYRPKLAISVYHDLQDFWSIPKYIRELELGYRFYLRHFTIHSEETILFAT